MKTKSTNLLLSLAITIILASSCKKDEDKIETDTTLREIETVKQYEVVSLYFSSDKLMSAEYNALLGDYSLQLSKLNDTTLVMCVPLVEPNIYTLDISTIGTYKNNFNVVKTELSDTPENTLSAVITGMFEYISALPDTDTDKKNIQSYFSAFNETFSAATSDEKSQIALFYNANKNVFDKIINNNYEDVKKNKGFISVNTPDSLSPILIKFSISVLAFGAGVWVAYTAPNIPVKLFGATLAIIGWKKAKVFGFELISKTMRIVDFSIDGILGSNNTETMVNDRVLRKSASLTQSKTPSLKFNDGVQQEFSIITTSRCININDRQSDISKIQVFFNSFDIFNSSIDKLNTIIYFISKNIPFANIDLIPNFQLLDLSNETHALSSESFENLTFSFSNPNLSHLKKLSSEGQILLTISVNKDFSYTNPFETQMSVSFTDDFNNISKDFSIEVIKVNTYSIEIVSGNNQTCSFESSPTDPIIFQIKEANGGDISNLPIRLISTAVGTRDSLYGPYRVDTLINEIRYTDLNGSLTVTDWSLNGKGSGEHGFIDGYNKQPHELHAYLDLPFITEVHTFAVATAVCNSQLIKYNISIEECTSCSIYEHSVKAIATVQGGSPPYSGQINLPCYPSYVFSYNNILETPCWNICDCSYVCPCYSDPSYKVTTNSYIMDNRGCWLGIDGNGNATGSGY